MVSSVIPQPVLDPNSEVPLYRQLHQHYTDLIRSGSLAQGERLPATRELAGLLGRPVGIVLVSGLKGQEAIDLPRTLDPL